MTNFIDHLSLKRRFGANYSRCGRYRYRLWREWEVEGGVVLWVMLNPSTADHLGNNDPTIERCERRSVSWGFRRMEVVNLFAWRSPRPEALRQVTDPVGPGNDQAIRAAARRADTIICAWGIHGVLHGRGKAMRTMLAGNPLWCLETTRSGEPAHPLYLPYERRPISYPQADRHSA